eukprot:gene10820-1968_t
MTEPPSCAVLPADLRAISAGSLPCSEEVPLDGALAALVEKAPTHNLYDMPSRITTYQHATFEYVHHTQPNHAHHTAHQHDDLGLDAPAHPGDDLHPAAPANPVQDEAMKDLQHKLETAELQNKVMEMQTDNKMAALEQKLADTAKRNGQVLRKIQEQQAEQAAALEPVIDATSGATGDDAVLHSAAVHALHPVQSAAVGHKIHQAAHIANHATHHDHLQQQPLESAPGMAAAPDSPRRQIQMPEPQTPEPQTPEPDADPKPIPPVTAIGPENAGSGAAVAASEESAAAAPSVLPVPPNHAQSFTVDHGVAAPVKRVPGTGDSKSDIGATYSVNLT